PPETRRDAGAHEPHPRSGGEALPPHRHHRRGPPQGLRPAGRAAQGRREPGAALRGPRRRHAAGRAVVAVSPVRALLISHFQTGLNRSMREMGRKGAIALALFGLVMAVFTLLPLTAGLGVAGWTLGNHIQEPWGPAALGAAYSAAAIGGGLMGGILGGSKSLDWERL